MKLPLLIAIAVVLFTLDDHLAVAPTANEQNDALPTRMVNVEGIQMRVWTAGLDHRQPGQPAIVREAGANGEALPDRRRMNAEETENRRCPLRDDAFSSRPLRSEALR